MKRNRGKRVFLNPLAPIFALLLPSLRKNIPNPGLARFSITIVVVRYGAICDTTNHFV